MIPLIFHIKKGCRAIYYQLIQFSIMIFVNINSKTKLVKIIDLSKSVDIFLVKNVHNVGNCIVLAK